MGKNKKCDWQAMQVFIHLQNILGENPNPHNNHFNYDERKELDGEKKQVNKSYNEMRPF